MSNDIEVGMDAWLETLHTLGEEATIQLLEDMKQNNTEPQEEEAPKYRLVA